MSANLPLPGGVFSHGFVNAADGRKMSKSYDNTIDPHDILDKYPLDSIRYYLIANTLGNLVHRGLNLCLKYCDGKVPDVEHDGAFALPFDVASLVRDISTDASICSLSSAIFRAMESVRATNRFLTEAEPWKMKGENEPRRVKVVRTTLEALYVLAHLLAPVIPITAQAMFDKLGSPPMPITQLRTDMYNLKAGTPVTV
eukprot:gene36838-48043_t